MSNLILIPARSGSTRVRDKNVRMLGGKPLVAHAVGAAVDSGAGRVVVSTDSEEIAAIAAAYGAETPFLRPKELSDAHASSTWCILHALQWFRENEEWEPDIVAFCPPTNPFLRPSSVREMCETLAKRNDVNSIVTVARPEIHPFTIVKRGPDDRLEVGVVSIDGKTILDLERSQDWPQVWYGAAACRATRCSFFFGLLEGVKATTDVTYGKTYDVDSSIGYTIDVIESFDIDDEADWALAEQIITMRQGSEDS